MSGEKATGPEPALRVPEQAVRVIREKDRIIRLQNKRIEQLESEVEKLKKERDSLSTKVTLLSYKLQLSSPKFSTDRDGGGGGSSSSRGGTNASGASTLPHSSSGDSTNSFKERSSSLGTPPSDARPSPGISRHRSSSGNSRLQRQRSYKRSDDEEKLKRSRAWANAYELSQDLHDKQLEMLERKYGGQMRSRRAARIIQQAFRQYSMNKNFERLKSNAGTEKRLSRRLNDIGRSNTIWTDMVLDSDITMGLDGYKQPMVTNKAATLAHPGHHHHHHSYTMVEKVAKHTTQRGVLQKSATMSMTMQEQVVLRGRKPLQRSMGLDLDTIKEGCRQNHTTANGNVGNVCAKPKTVSPVEETNNNRNSYPEMNDSSASDSPQDTPVEPTVDMASVNFENLLESKETDILNDSFHSDSSQDGAGPTPVSGMPGVPGAAFTTWAYDHSGSLEALSSEQSTPKAIDESFHSQYSESTCSDSTSITSDVQIRVNEDGVDGLLNDSDRTPTQDDPTVITKVYANQEVRLRKKKSPTLEAASPDSAGGEGTDPSLSVPGKPSKLSPEASPIWKRKSAVNGASSEDIKRMSNISEASEPDSIDGGRGSREGLSSSASSDTASMSSAGDTAPTYNKMLPCQKETPPPTVPPKITDRQRKRLYRIGLNLFNKKPEKGIKYLIERRFIENRPSSAAKFLISRKGLSKQMIGEFLGNLQKEFNMQTLECFTQEIDLSGLQVDIALRNFQSHFRMPGEAQKIERLMEAFAQRYCMCNPDQVKKFKTADTIFLLAFAIIMLNTDLHNDSIKQERKMKLEDFIKNLRGVDDEADIDRDILTGIYERIKTSELKPGPDHVSQVMKVEQMIVGKKPQLPLPHRRLVCYCRLYQINDPNKREKLGLHQREVFLFNDVLVVTKIFSKKKNNVTYSYRQSFPLCGMQVYLFETQHYKHGLQLTTTIDEKILITFNARNEHDWSKFVEDLKEAILEMTEMEALRIEEELNKQKVGQPHRTFSRHSNDSGMVDIELLKPSDPGTNRLSAPECGGLKKNALSNSLIDLTESMRRGSGGSLDSGMASAGSGMSNSHEDNSAAGGKAMKGQGSSSRFSLFGKKSKGNSGSKTSLKNISQDSSEV